MRRTARALAALIAAALALTACAGLPTSGPVNPGFAADEVPDSSFLYYPEGPASGATPEQIVQGFVEAATSPAGDWATAREFLTTDFADEWRPGSAVTIDATSARQYDASGLESDGVVAMQVSQIATVDPRGVYSAATTRTQSLQYELAREDGQWRIASAPEGIVLDRDYFPNVYSDYTLLFYDTTGRYLVPDVRWFPESSVRPTLLTAELLLGPSAALRGAVQTAFPEGTRLAEGSVVALDDNGVADVTLQGVAPGVDSSVVARMRGQLTATLAGVGAQGVRLRTGTVELSAEEHDPLPTRPDSRALVLAERGSQARFGFLSGGDIERIDGLSDAIEEAAAGEPRSISVQTDRSRAVLQGADGVVFSLAADGTALVLDDRERLIEPALDPSGYVWNVPASAPDELTAVAIGGGDALPMGFPPVEAFAVSSVQSIAVSRDGTRLAALVSAADGGAWAVVAPVLRGPDGLPRGVGDALVLASLDGPGIDVEWLDDSSIGVVARDSGEVEILEQRIGGPGTRMSAPSNTAGVAAGTQGSPMRLIDSEGGVYVRRGSAWVQTGADVAVLATDVGAPGVE